MPGPVYLDCAATCPLDPRVRDEVRRYAEDDFGNAGSRTHRFGQVARTAVERARARVAEALGVRRTEVVFTSGATEANNLAILGLEAHGRATGRLHLVSTAIEHHAVLEPLRALESRGFELTLVAPEPGGWVDAGRVLEAVRDDTLLVSIMHVNNETGIVQPVAAIAEGLEAGPFLHVDAVQGFGKEAIELRPSRIDLLSISAHKLCGPKGAGALVARRRSGERPPLTPLVHGGGQEMGLRPGTLPVPLIAGLGLAVELAVIEREARAAAALALRRRVLDGLAALRPAVNGEPARAIPQILNLSLPGLDAESVMEAWEGLAAVSDGAACTSQSYTCSHVLAAMRLPAERQAGAIRLSWCHLTPTPDVEAMAAALEPARVAAGPAE